MVFMLLCFCKIDVSAHDAYYLAVVVDESTNTYHGEIVHESGNNHREVDVGGFLKCVKNNNSSDNVPEIDYTSDAEPKYPVDKKGTNDAMIFTFPSSHTLGILVDKVDASDYDLALAQRVMDYPLAGLNDALTFVLNKSGWSSTNGTKENLKTIGMHLANLDSSFTVNGVNVSVSTTSGKKINDVGIKADDYVSVSVGGESKTFVYRCKKGYVDDDENDKLYYMSTSKYDKYKKNCKDKGDVQYIDWKLLVMQGNYNADVNGATYSSIATVTSPNEFSSLLNGFFADMITSIRSALGVYNIDELMVNEGSRDSNYILGMYPDTWGNAILLLHIICQMIAWGCIGFAIIKLVWQRQLATMNIVEKISWQESIKNLLLCGFMLGSFTIIFNFLARLNYRLVDLFSASTSAESFSILGGASGASTFGQIVISAAVLILTIYFNFFYFLRAITIAILYGLAPLAIYTLSLGGKFSSVFSTYMKELLGNVFMQTIHAILIAFFCNITMGAKPRTLEMLVLLYAFIPLGKFVKEKVFGIGAGLDGAAGGLARMATSVAGGVVGGFMGAKAGSKRSSGGKGGSAPSENNGSLNQQLDTQMSNSRGDADVNLKDDPSAPNAYNANAHVNATKEVSAKSTFGRGSSVASVVKGAGKVAAHGATGLAMVGAGTAMSAIDPAIGAKMVGTGGSHLGSIKGDIAGTALDMKQNNNFRKNMQYNGVDSMRAGKDYTTYDLGGSFDSNGTFTANPIVDKEGNKITPEISADHKADYENMYMATKLHNTGQLDEKGNEKYKKTYENMRRNQIAMQINGDKAIIVRRTADVQRASTSAHDPLAKGDPLAGVSKLRAREENRDVYPHTNNRPKPSPSQPNPQPNPNPQSDNSKPPTNV